MKSPFIHLIHSPTGFYFYDVNRNVVVSINGNISKALQLALEHDLSIDEVATTLNENDQSFLHSFVENGYLSSNRVQEIAFPAPEIAKTLLERKLHKITLQVTQSCNFRCRYCIYTEGCDPRQRTHTQKNMTEETAKKAVDYLLAHSVDSETVNIGFYGGEPLLVFPLVRYIVDYAEKLFVGKKLTFNLTTNGSLLSPQIVDFLIQHNISLLISLDGPKDINDKNRVFAANGEGTYDAVVRNILMITQKYPEYAKKVRISMVVDPSNSYESINSFSMEMLGLENYNLISTYVDDEFSSEKVRMTYDYYKKSQYQEFMSYLSFWGILRGKRIAVTEQGIVNSVLSSIKQMVPQSSLPICGIPSGPCIAGLARLFVTVDGALLPCERVGETSKVMQIGDLQHGIVFDKALNLINIAKITEDECRNCWAFRLCNICCKCADGDNYLSAELKKKHCEYSISNAEVQLKRMIMLQEIPLIYRKSFERRALING